MKIHNYGSDYAFQQKQKSEQEKQQVTEPEVKSEPDVTNQVQTGGEGNVAVSPQEGEKATEQEISSEGKQETQRKEKKTTIKAKVQQDSQLQ